MGHTTDDTHGEGFVQINFLKNGEVVGFIKAIAGEGFQWSYPEELFEEEETIEPTAEDCWDGEPVSYCE